MTVNLVLHFSGNQRKVGKISVPLPEGGKIKQKIYLQKSKDFPVISLYKSFYSMNCYKGAVNNVVDHILK